MKFTIETFELAGLRLFLTRLNVRNLFDNYKLLVRIGNFYRSVCTYLCPDVFFTVGRLLLVVNVVDSYNRIFLPEGTQGCLNNTFTDTLLLHCVNLYLFRVLCFFYNEYNSIKLLLKYRKKNAMCSTFKLFKFNLNFVYKYVYGYNRLLQWYASIIT